MNNNFSELLCYPDMFVEVCKYMSSQDIYKLTKYVHRVNRCLSLSDNRLNIRVLLNEITLYYNIPLYHLIVCTHTAAYHDSIIYKFDEFNRVYKNKDYNNHDKITALQRGIHRFSTHDDVRENKYNMVNNEVVRYNIKNRYSKTCIKSTNKYADNIDNVIQSYISQHRRCGKKSNKGCKKYKNKFNKNTCNKNSKHNKTKDINNKHNITKDTNHTIKNPTLLYTRYKNKSSFINYIFENARTQLVICPCKYLHYRISIFANYMSELFHKEHWDDYYDNEYLKRCGYDHYDNMNKFTSIDPSYKFNYEHAYEIPNNYMVEKFNDKLSYEHNVDNCSMCLISKDNLTITGKNLKFLLLCKCDNITIPSSVGAKVDVIIKNSTNITFNGDVRCVRMYSDVDNCTFQNIDVLENTVPMHNRGNKCKTINNLYGICCMKAERINKLYTNTNKRMRHIYDQIIQYNIKELYLNVIYLFNNVFLHNVNSLQKLYINFHECYGSVKAFHSKGSRYHISIKDSGNPKVKVIGRASKYEELVNVIY